MSQIFNDDSAKFVDVAGDTMSGALTISTSAGPQLTIKDGGTAGTNADPYLRFMDAFTEMGYVGFSVDSLLHMYISNLKNGDLILGTNNKNLITISDAAASFVLQRDTNGATRSMIKNYNTGSAAYARFTVSSDAGDVNLDANSVAAGAIAQLNVDSSFTAGFEISLGGARTFGVRTNGTLGFTLDGNQKAVIGASGSTQIHQINGDTGTAGSDSMTMTNGPAGSAGNPAVFLKLNINGTSYIVPAWNFT